MDELWLRFSALLLEILVVFGGVIWAVAKIKSTTDGLRGTIDRLATSIEELKRTIERLENRQYEQAQQIAALTANQKRDQS